jgi:hypothetical protein
MLVVDIKEEICDDVEQVYIDFIPALLACSIHVEPIFQVAYCWNSQSLRPRSTKAVILQDTVKMTTETNSTSPFVTNKYALNHIVSDSRPMMA